MARSVDAEVIMLSFAPLSVLIRHFFQRQKKQSGLPRLFPHVRVLLPPPPPRPWYRGSRSTALIITHARSHKRARPRSNPFSNRESEWRGSPKCGMTELTSSQSIFPVTKVALAEEIDGGRPRQTPPEVALFLRLPPFQWRPQQKNCRPR